MNIQEYISSGILESYVLGELSDAERAAVEQNLEKYPEIQIALRQIEVAQEELLMRAAIAPPAHIRARVLNPPKEANAIALQTGRVNFLRFAAAASLLVAVVSLYFTFMYRQRWQTTRQELVALTDQNKRIAEDYDRVNQEVEKIRADVDVIANPDFRRVAMSGTANSPDARATVYWNEKTNEVYLSLQEMKDISAAQQYQLWAIIDGKPIDAGVFDKHTAGLVKMKNIRTGAVKFAVTIEPRGGRSSPTLETMQVIGDVPKG